MRPGVAAAALALLVVGLVLPTIQVPVRWLAARPADSVGVGLGDTLTQRLSAGGRGTGRFAFGLQLLRPNVAPDVCVTVSSGGSPRWTWAAGGPLVAGGGFASPGVDVPPGDYEVDFAIARGTVIAGGWAVDPVVAAGSGVDGVVGFLDGGPGVGRYLGAAQYGLESPDAATTYGPRAASAGWSLAFDDASLAPGAHELDVFARSSRSRLWTGAVQRFQLAPATGCDAKPPTLAPGSSVFPKLAQDQAAPLRIGIAVPGTGDDHVAVLSHGATAGSGAVLRNGVPEAGAVAVALRREVPAPEYLAGYPATIATTAPAALLVLLNAGWLLAAAVLAGLVLAAGSAADRIGRR